MSQETYTIERFDIHTGWADVEHHAPTNDPMVWNHSFQFPSREAAWEAVKQETKWGHPVRVHSSVRGLVYKTTSKITLPETLSCDFQGRQEWY
jgi:hypothetical protein